jgi:hypothetical protein
MNQLKQRYLILTAFAYSIEDEKDATKKNEGISMWYFPDDKLDPIWEDGGRLGKAPLKGNVPIDKSYKLNQVPGLYDCTIEIKMVRGQPGIAIKDIDFVSGVKLVEDKPSESKSKKEPINF